VISSSCSLLFISIRRIIRRQPRAEIDNLVLDAADVPLQRLAALRVRFGRGFEFALVSGEQDGEFLV
jgi:hypothetical protein